MSWISDAGAGRNFTLRQYALPDFRFSFQLYGTHWRQVREGWSYPDHDHPLFELNIVLEGAQVMTMEGTEYALNEGDLLLIPPGAVHRARIGQSESMTYFCLHLDIDDAVYYGQIAGLGGPSFAADSELTRKLRPFIDRMVSLSDTERKEGADAGLVIRASVLNILLALGEYAEAAAPGGAGQAAESARQREGHLSAVQRLRERNALEKKVQDMFRASPDGNAPVNKSLLPPFRWAGLFSVMIPDRSFWTKPERFWAKILLEDALSEHGNAVIIVGEQLMTAVLFSDRITVPSIEEHATRSKSLLEHHLNVSIRLGIGGVAPSAGGLRGLYRQSLSGLGMTELYPAQREFDFISRIIRLAMLMIESDYADPDLSLGMLAKRLELTPNYLSALFKAETGHTFTWHLSRFRIDQAKKRLKETNMKVYQVGKLVGYADQAYFSRLFKAVVGVSPGEYRASAPEE